MSSKKIINLPLNRVEGDLEIRVELKDGVVVEAWSSGTMYRGFETMMVGRAPLDSLVITPRICGICSTAHLMAAARALDSAAKVDTPDNARRVRNLALMAEHLQNDMRHAFLMFTPDLANDIYAEQPLFEEASRRYAPFKGETVVEVIQQTKRLMEIVAILGGQWPHSSYMVPGGVVSLPSRNDLLQCQHLLNAYRLWYEARVLGCSLERWEAVSSAADLDAWLDESPRHAQSDLGFFIRFAWEVGLATIGRGHGNFVSFGGLEMPRETTVVPLGQHHGKSGAGRNFIPAGFATGIRVEPFDQARIAEDISHSWFKDDGHAKHPFAGETKPYATGREGQQYSWAKAPRYDGQPAEVGPLAEMIVSGHPLFADLVERNGPNAFVRELARIGRAALWIPAMERWLEEIADCHLSFYEPSDTIESGEGFGLTEAARGALGHWVIIEGGEIVRYQVISPTTWNGSPRDAAGVRGPWEQALIGTAVREPKAPVEIGHVVRSFDPCLVCTVHTLDMKCDRRMMLVV
jgi:Ni,Fe-hydrogenase I large subunit